MRFLAAVCAALWLLGGCNHCPLVEQRQSETPVVERVRSSRSLSPWTWGPTGGPEKPVSALPSRHWPCGLIDPRSAATPSG